MWEASAAWRAVGKSLFIKKNGEKANLPLWLCFSNIFLSLIWDYLSWTCKWHLIYVHVYIQNLCSGLAFFLPRLYFIPLKTRKYSVLLKQISFSFDEGFRRIVSSQRYNEGNGVVRPLGKGGKKGVCISAAKWDSAGHTSMLGRCSGAFFFFIEKIPKRFLLWESGLLECSQNCFKQWFQSINLHCKFDQSGISLCSEVRLIVVYFGI